MADGRRHSERIQILGDLPGAATVQQHIFVKELSDGGAQIESTFPLVLNAIHEFRLALGSVTVVVKGRVVYCRIEDVDAEALVYRAGIEFVEMPDWVAGAVKDFLAALKDGRQA
jgi:PilZ domain-containing protein